MSIHRILYVLVAGAVVLAEVSLGRPEWLNAPVRAETGHRAVMPPDARSEVIVTRIRAKGEVIRLLLAKEITLEEATQSFSFYNRTPAGVEDVSWRGFPGKTEDEKVRSQVLLWVRISTEGQVPCEGWEGAKTELTGGRMGATAWER